MRVKTRVADLQPVASVTPVWPSANWLEREVFDMFGVNFSGHPDRRRILMPDDWQVLKEVQLLQLPGQQVAVELLVILLF